MSESSNTVLIGINGKLMVGPKGSSPTAALNNCVDVQLKLGTTTGDATTRGSGNVELSVVTLLNVEVSLKMLNIPGDTDLKLVLAAYASLGALSVKCIDQDSGVGVDGDFCVTQCDRDESNKNIQQYSVTLKPTVGRKVTFPGLNVESLLASLGAEPSGIPAVSGKTTSKPVVA